MAKEIKKKSGGSTTLDRRGIKRFGGENGTSAAENFCVIDGPNAGDLSEAAIRKLYKGNAWAQACITAALDLYRAGDAAPEFFWKLCRGGNHTAVRYVDLGEGSDGVVRLLIADGRHRKDAIIRVNVEREQMNEIEPLPLFSLALKVPADPVLAAKIIMELKTTSNVRVAMAPSHNAYRAFELHAAGESDYAIGVKLGFPAALAEQETAKLLTLAMCCAEIRKAVDAGEVPIEKIAKWRNARGDLTKTAEEQIAWLNKRTAPREQKPRSAARPMTPKKVDALARELSPGPLFDLLAVLSGKAPWESVTDPDLRAACLRAFGGAS